MAKEYLATKEQVESINTNIASINDRLEPIDLSSIDVLPMDFINDPITIISGGLSTYDRIISN